MYGGGYEGGGWARDGAGGPEVPEVTHVGRLVWKIRRGEDGFAMGVLMRWEPLYCVGMSLCA